MDSVLMWMGRLAGMCMLATHTVLPIACKQPVLLQAILFSKD